MSLSGILFLSADVRYMYMICLFQVLQESIEVQGTNAHLVYHSSETEGYKSVILIQMTPDAIPTNLALVHLKVYVQGIENVKVFEADPGLKYTFSWDRINAFRQKVYGIVPVKVHVGYEYKGCDYVFWEVRSTTMTGFDLTSSEIGGWNLDIHHTYNFQEGKSLWIWIAICQDWCINKLHILLHSFKLKEVD